MKSRYSQCCGSNKYTGHYNKAIQIVGMKMANNFAAKC
jgi:hypothetical protein